MEASKSNFSDWYNEIIELSGLTDKRYPVKGMNIWMPYGFSLMKNIDELIRKRFYLDGFQEVMFPSLISRQMFEIEFEHIKGFEKELFWIAKGGKDSLEDDLAMRPTSESAIYPMLKLWIRDQGDLPMRLFQIVQVYRYETKHTRPFIRSRDIHFIECHTAHRDYSDSEAQMKLYLDEWKYFASSICIPFLEVKRPDWDKFPGAVYTIAFDTLMPSGRTLQIGTIHQYGTNFSSNYEVRFANENGESANVNQTTFGMSERLIGALVGIHGDDKGLILPPDVAPIQIVIVPIGEAGSEMNEYIAEIERDFQQLGLRYNVDRDDKYTPGFKFNQWEMKGVPLRVEIGGREVESKTLTISLRTRKGRQKLAFADIGRIKEHLSAVSGDLLERAKKILEAGLEGKLEGNLESTIKTSIICDDRTCAEVLEKKYDMTMMGSVLNYGTKGKCEVCGKDGRTSLFSRPY